MTDKYESLDELFEDEEFEISEESENFKIKTKTDNQLNYAIKLLNG